MRWIASWYYEQDHGEGGAYAQVRGRSDHERFRDVYRRCIAVFYESARRANPGARLTLILNRPWRTDATDVATWVGTRLSQLDVQINVVSYNFSPPPAWQLWRNQFFVFDAMTELARIMERNDSVLLLDSDMVWSGSPATEAMWEAVEQDGCATYIMDYPWDYPINGMTLAELTELSNELGSLAAESPHGCRYAGGEFIALRKDVLELLVETSAALWPRLMERERAGMVAFPEEAHMLSHLYRIHALPLGNANPFVKRIWTQALHHRNTTPADRHLPLWHLPAEKRYGLRRVFTDIIASGPAVLDDMDSVAERLGIGGNTPRKLASDVGAAAASRAREVILRHCVLSSQRS